MKVALLGGLRFVHLLAFRLILLFLIYDNIIIIKII